MTDIAEARAPGLDLALPWRHSFAGLGPAFHTELKPTPLPAPYLVSLNAPLATELGLDPDWVASAAGVQVFTANSWKDLRGKDGAVYPSRAGIAFETQRYPNAPNTPAFNPVPLRPGQVYRHVMSIQFEALGPSQLAALRAGGG